MPFQSKAQARAAFGGYLGEKMKRSAKEWASKTDFSKIPEKKKKKTEKSMLFLFRKAINKLPILKSNGSEIEDDSAK